MEANYTAGVLTTLVFVSGSSSELRALEQTDLISKLLINTTLQTDGESNRHLPWIQAASPGTLGYNALSSPCSDLSRTQRRADPILLLYLPGQEGLSQWEWLGCRRMASEACRAVPLTCAAGGDLLRKRRASNDWIKDPGPTEYSLAPRSKAWEILAPEFPSRHASLFFFLWNVASLFLSVMTHERDVRWRNTLTCARAYVGWLGIWKARHFRRVRAGVSEINIILASCKQTSAFPRELPGARFAEHEWCAKSSVWIPSSRDDREQAWSQN